jgi:hypothetical protein
MRGISIMYEPELLAVATGAAGTIVAAITTWGAETMRVRVGHFFHRATPEQQRAAVQAVNETVAQLDSPGADPAAIAATTWTGLIARYVAEYPDALDEVGELSALTAPVSKVWQQQNTGTGTFIGGDVHGGVVFNNGGLVDGGN